MLDLFISANAEGEFGFTTLGYTALAVLAFALLVLVASLGNQEKKFSAKKLAFCAAAIALAFVASHLKLFRMPMGGSVTLFSMFFIVFAGYLYGPSVGVAVGMAYGLLHMLVNPYIISLPQALIDYVFAYGALGLSGFLSNKKNGIITGYILSVLGRYFFAVLSGVIFFGMYAPEGKSPLLYSLTYNGGYLGAEAALTIIVLLIPAVRKGLAQVKAMARS